MTIGVADVLREAMKDQRVKTAFEFGSIAAGSENAGSDVDLFVIGEIGLRDLSELLSGCLEKIGREINPSALTKDEFRKRVKAGEHFISNVLNSRKLFIVGTEHDLEAMAG